jgi:hypothetical protein
MRRVLGRVRFPRGARVGSRPGQGGEGSVPDTSNSVTEKPGGDEYAKRGDGWRSQPLALKILLSASLALMAVGIVRCSFETTAPPPEIARIGVAPVAAEIAEDVLEAPADSVASRVRRMFVRALEGASTAEVVAVPGATTDAAAAPREAGDADSGGAVSGDVDALVSFGVRYVRGELAVDGDIRDAATGRVLHTIKVSGPPKMLSAMLDIAARKASLDLGIAEEILHDHN